MSDNILSVEPDFFPAAKRMMHPVSLAIATSLAHSRNPNMHLISRRMTTAPDFTLFDAIYASRQPKSFLSHVFDMIMFSFLSIKPYLY